MNSPVSLHRLRAHGARALVRWVSRWMDASYLAYCRVEAEEVPGWWDKPWGFGARWSSRVALPVARRLDREATTDQMIEECWWG